ncbi:uncharacterized protein LOC144679660 [Cetorhinus maximus]
MAAVMAAVWRGLGATGKQAVAAARGPALILRVLCARTASSDSEKRSGFAVAYELHSDLQRETEPEKPALGGRKTCLAPGLVTTLIRMWIEELSARRENIKIAFNQNDTKDPSKTEVNEGQEQDSPMARTVAEAKEVSCCLLKVSLVVPGLHCRNSSLKYSQSNHI